MKKQVIALLLTLVVVLSIFGCAPSDNSITMKPDATAVQTDPTIPENVKGYDRVDVQVLDFNTDLYNSIELTKGYESLESDAQRKFYRLLEDSVFYISQKAEKNLYSILPVNVDKTKFTEAELHLIISAFNFDHPEVFWIDSSFSYYNTSGSTHLILSSFMSAQQVSDCAKEMYAELREFFSGMPGNLSEFDRELFIHDRLLERCEYADESTRAQEMPDIYTSLGAIVDGVAVCEGYTRAVQLMLSLVGVEGYYVYGRGDNELHMWNSVRLGDNWYYLDATWNDGGEKGPSYDDFNITTEQILKERSIAPLYWDLTSEEVCGSGSGVAMNFNIFIPECNSDNMSFYAHNAVTVTGFDDDNLSRIALAIAQAAQEGDEAVYLYIDPYYLDFETAKENLFYSGDYAIFTCISMANEQLTGVAVNNESIATEESANLSVITIYPEYE